MPTPLFDVAIIGSGPLGALCARRLAEQGLNILMLEAGEVISTPAGSHLRNDLAYHKDPDSFVGEINRWGQFYNRNGSSDELPGANNTKAFGGQGLLWFNNCPRPSDFELWPAMDACQWDTCFKQAEIYLHVHDDIFDHSIRQQKIIKKLSNYLLQIMPQRCIRKVPVAAEKSNDHGFYFIATKEIMASDLPICKQIKIMCNSKVLKLNVDKKRVTHITFQSGEGTVRQIKSKYIIIAAGAIETTQILYNSYVRSEALGKYLHYHPLILAQIILENGLCSDHHEIDLPARLYIPPTSNYPWHALLVRNIFASNTTEQAHENQLLELEFFAPMEIRRENQVLLNKSNCRFKVSLTRNDQLLIEKMRVDLYKIAQQLGHFRQGCEPAIKAPGFAHPMGMCRMGIDPATSVANYKGQIHGIDNLFLSTVGLIPVAIAVNPTLTAAALAIATTDYIIQQG